MTTPIDPATLVTEAAIDAVMRWLPHFVAYTDDGLERARYTTRRNLETAAPHIAAEALRQATSAPFLNVMETPTAKLLRLADELERGQ